MPKVIIVGAGISGLSLAFRLQESLPGADITVLEQGTRPGGTMWTEQHGDFRIEIGPNGFLDTKPATYQLCIDLGIADRLVAASPAAGRNRYLFLNGRLQLLPHNLRSLLASELLSWRGKCSLFFEPLRPRRRGPHDESIDAFARRRVGAEVAEVFADALVTGIYAGDPRLLSLRASFPRIAHFEEQYGSVMKGMSRSARQRRHEAKRAGSPQASGKMWSFPEGLRRLIEALSEQLTRPPSLGVAVRRVLRTSTAEWTVEAAKDRWTADAVVLTCPAYQQAAILHDLDSELAEHLSRIPYNRVAVVALGYRESDVPRSLDGFGYIAPQRFRRDVLGVQWCSSIFPQRAPPGLVLLRALCGGWHRPEVPGWSDDRLLDAVRADLRLSLGITSPPVLHHIVRWDRAIPQYHLGHLERVVAIEARAARFPGLFLAGNALHGVAINDCTEQATFLARNVQSFFGSGSVCS